MDSISTWLACPVLCFTFSALDARGQWTPTLWPPTNIVASAVWTDDAGTSRTGSVKDARAMEMAHALDERHIAAGLATNAYRPKWYLWQRANAVRFKAAASNALPYYAARWLSDGTNFTGPAAASNWTAVPRMTHTGVVAHLGLPTNFWTFTPWIAVDQSSNGLAGIKRLLDLMTWTVQDGFAATAQMHSAENYWSSDPVTYPYLYNDGAGGWPEETDWAGAQASVEWSWDSMQYTPYDGSTPDMPYACVTSMAQNAYFQEPDPVGPALYSRGSFDGSTNWRAVAVSAAYAPGAAAVTNWERALDWYHTASGIVTFAAGGHGVATTATRMASIAANAEATNIAAAVGEMGLPKTFPTWCAEPTAATNATGLGYRTQRMEWVLRWDATTYGFRFVEGE